MTPGLAALQRDMPTLIDFKTRDGARSNEVHGQSPDQSASQARGGGEAMSVRPAEAPGDLVGQTGTQQSQPSGRAESNHRAGPTFGSS